jgi:hypothetical protein
MMQLLRNVVKTHERQARDNRQGFLPRHCGESTRVDSAFEQDYRNVFKPEETKKTHQAVMIVE